MPFETLNKFLATLTLIADIKLCLFLILSIFIFAFHMKSKLYEKLLSFVSKNILLFGFILTTFGTIASLFYSEVAHLVPCSLCWYQRLFLFPQAILFGIAYIRKDRNILDYSIVLTSIGLLIGAYHILVQLGFSLPVPCSVNALTSCATKNFTYYGFVTIPVMSFTAFASLLLLLIIAKVKKPGFFS